MTEDQTRFFCLMYGLACWATALALIVNGVWVFIRNRRS